MRVFLPLVPHELRADALPIRTAAIPAAEKDGVDRELAEYDATIDASIQCLELIREAAAGPYRRLVAAVDVKTARDTEEVAVTWDWVSAILVDGDDAQNAVRHACEATTQEEADAAVATVLDHALEWFSTEERLALADALLPRDGDF
ncbi:MAG: hypothetical protein Q4P05_07340 [Actinomycetaceae bacterium]|nr:hypothetical protein [Actinomycetaceae bacterium]